LRAEGPVHVAAITHRDAFRKLADNHCSLIGPAAHQGKQLSIRILRAAASTLLYNPR